MSREERLGRKNLPEEIRSPVEISDRSDNLESSNAANGSLEEMEKQMIQNALRNVGGNKSLAAKKLGISRRTLYRKIDEYHL